MKLLLLISLTYLSHAACAQVDSSVSAIAFVQILNQHEEEAIFYYEHNWKELRDMAVEKGYIQSYQILETPYSEEEPFHLMLITTYPSQTHFEQREENFEGLIKAKGGLSLLNEKKPGEFRKVLFGKEGIRTLFRSE